MKIVSTTRTIEFTVEETQAITVSRKRTVVSRRHTPADADGALAAREGSAESHPEMKLGKYDESKL